MDTEQSQLWNGVAGRTWSELHALLDDAYRPFESLIVEAVSAIGARRVLDVGCGTGSVSLAIARRLQSTGSCTGVDLSAPMLDVARARAKNEPTPPAFVLADAQTHAFDPQSFDAIVSRFGVMFFDDPTAAFANLRRSARKGASLHLFTWRSPAENAFMTTPERVATRFIPDFPARRADAPGQYAFADPDRVRKILEESGWSAIDIVPVDVPCAIPQTEIPTYVTRMGPVGRMLPQLDGATREKIVEETLAALSPYVEHGEVRFTSACWRIGARA